MQITRASGLHFSMPHASHSQAALRNSAGAQRSCFVQTAAVAAAERTAAAAAAAAAERTAAAVEAERTESAPEEIAAETAAAHRVSLLHSCF